MCAICHARDLRISRSRLPVPQPRPVRDKAPSPPRGVPAEILPLFALMSCCLQDWMRRQGRCPVPGILARPVLYRLPLSMWRCKAHEAETQMSRDGLPALGAIGTWLAHRARTGCRARAKAVPEIPPWHVLADQRRARPTDRHDHNRAGSFGLGGLAVSRRSGGFKEPAHGAGEGACRHGTSSEALVTCWDRPCDLACPCTPDRRQCRSATHAADIG
mgnify:CR=1 FL=1|jgi:hypothetical protein